MTRYRLALHNEQLTKRFLAQGPEPNAQCGIDYTTLSVAIERGSSPTIKLLFDHGGSIRCGQLLQYAAERKAPEYLEVIDFLLDKGAQISDIMYKTTSPKDYFQLEAFAWAHPCTKRP